MDNKITIPQALTSIRGALEGLTVQGSQNAKLLSAICDDLDQIIQALMHGGEKKDGEQNA